MRSWTEAYEDVTPPPTEEEREADLRRAVVALASGHDISRGRPGQYGRCGKHRIRGCQCGGAK